MPDNIPPSAKQDKKGRSCSPGRSAQDDKKSQGFRPLRRNSSATSFSCMNPLALPSSNLSPARLVLSLVVVLAGYELAALASGSPKLSLAEHVLRFVKSSFAPVLDVRLTPANVTGRSNVSEKQQELGEWAFYPGEKFMWYSSHGGFGNQVIGLKWALRLSSILNRTLVLPPKLPHVNPIPSTGRCDRNPHRQAKLRRSAWLHYSTLLRTPNYVSMGDVLDVASLPRRLFRTIDLRHFAILFCGCDTRPSCSGSLCMELHKLNSVRKQKDKAAMKCLLRCGNRLGARERESLSWEDSGDLLRVDWNCADTVYTIGHYSRLQDLVSAVGPGQLHLLLPSTYSASNAGMELPKPRRLADLFGPGTNGQKAKVLAFGSCFQPRISDIEVVKEEPVPEIARTVITLPLAPPIMALARWFVNFFIKEEFVCMHIRGGDGFFKQMLQKTLQDAEQRLDRLLERGEGTNAAAQDKMKNNSLALFLMTDVSWDILGTTFISSLPSKNVHLWSILVVRELIARVGRSLVAEELGFRANRVDNDQVAQLRWINPPNNQTEVSCRSSLKSWLDLSESPKKRRIQKEPEDMTLFVEQAICCHNTLGLVHTEKSTASGLVHAIRRGDHCVLFPQCFGKADKMQ